MGGRGGKGEREGEGGGEREGGKERERKRESFIFMTQIVASYVQPHSSLRCKRQRRIELQISSFTFPPHKYLHMWHNYQGEGSPFNGG